MSTCTICGETKELDAFGFRSKKTGRRHRTCKACVAAYGRGHYAANRLAYVSRNNQRSRSRTCELKTQVWQYLSEHLCVDCREADPLVLEFDHMDPAMKRKTIYKLVHQAYSWSAILAEIERCQVRCANCHRRRTAAQFGWAKLGFSVSGAEHFWPSRTPAVPRRPRRPGPPRNRSVLVSGVQAVLIPGSRFCVNCGLAKPLEEFHYRHRATETRHSICGTCFNAYRRDHYRMNRHDYIRRNGALQRRRRLEWQRRLWEYLSVHPCVDCREQDPLVLEFDHVDRTTKEFTMGFMATRGHAWPTVLSELAKCEVRCANCHRRRTAAQFGWPKLSVAASWSSSDSKLSAESRVRVRSGPPAVDEHVSRAAATENSIYVASESESALSDKVVVQQKPLTHSSICKPDLFMRQRSHNVSGLRSRGFIVRAAVYQDDVLGSRQVQVRQYPLN